MKNEIYSVREGKRKWGRKWKKRMGNKIKGSSKEGGINRRMGKEGKEE